MKETTLDPKILNKNLEITKLTKQVDDLTSDNVDLKEKLKFNDKELHFLLTEVHERMYPMMEYCEKLQPVKINSDSSDKYKGTINLTNEDEMMMTKLFRLVELPEETTVYDDQTSRSILKDLRKVIKSLEE